MTGLSPGQSPPPVRSPMRAMGAIVCPRVADRRAPRAASESLADAPQLDERLRDRPGCGRVAAVLEAVALVDPRPPGELAELLGLVRERLGERGDRIARRSAAPVVDRALADRAVVGRGAVRVLQDALQAGRCPQVLTGRG